MATHGSRWWARPAITTPVLILLAFLASAILEHRNAPDALAEDPLPDVASGIHSANYVGGVGGPVAAAPPLGGTNINVSNNTSAQNETTIAINPTNLDNIIGGANDYGGGAPNGDCGRYFSTDGGATWTRSLMPRQMGFASAGDPGVAFASNGNAFYLCMNFNGGAGDATQYVHKSLDGGATWGPAVLVAGSPMANFDDKGHIAVDNISGTEHHGNVYVSFTRINAAEIHFNRSVDGGASFTGCPGACADFVISDSDPDDVVVQGSNIAVGADGAVYVAWADFDGTDSHIMIDKSIDGGENFDALTGGTDHVVRTFDAIGNPGGPGIRPLARVNSFPVIKAHPTDPDIIYAVWAEDPAGADDSDIMFARSLDGGDTWGTPDRINDDINPTGDFNSQFFPWMAVDPVDGEIDIVWYDDRNWTKTGNPLVDLYFASSTDDGISFSANLRVSTASSDVTVQFNPDFFGDYNGIDARGGVAMPLWTQTVSGDEEAFTTQIGGADLAITKTDSPDPVSAGGNLIYTITVENNGPATAFNTTVVDTLPGPVTYVADTDACMEGPTDTLTCDLGTLADGASTSFTIAVKVDSDAVANGFNSITNTAVVSSDQQDPDLSDNTAMASTLVNASADLRVLKECKPDQPSAAPAGTVTFCDIYVDNLGPSDAVNVVLTDQIISSVDVTVTDIDLSSTNGDPGECMTAPDPPGPAQNITITCTDDLLPAGARNTIKVFFTASDAGDVNDTATVTSDTPDPNAANNSAVGRVSFAAAADLAIVKTDSPDPVVAGEQITYEIEVTNNGPSTATGVIVRDDLSGFLTNVMITSPDNTCDAGVPGNALLPLTCNLGNLDNGAVETITIVADVRPDTPNGTILFNQARVSATSADPDNSDNNASVSTVVNAVADLQIVKTSDAASYKPNTPVTYSITVTNLGPSDAQNVVVVDDLPDPKQVVYQSNTGGCVFQAPKTLTCNLGVLSAGDSEVFFIVVTVKGGNKDVSNTATVSSTTEDDDAVNNASTRVVSISGGGGNGGGGGGNGPCGSPPCGH